MHTYKENTAWLSKPIMGQAAFSCGIMYSASKTDNQPHYDYISVAYDLNDHFVYRENIFSAYADVKYKLSKRLETKVGLRGEYGKLNGESIKMDTRTVKRQLDFFPTAYLNYDWNSFFFLLLICLPLLIYLKYLDKILLNQ